MKKLLIWILILCGMGVGQRHETAVPVERDQITGAWLEENLEHVTLELYYIDPYVLTRAPVTVEQIKKSCDIHVTVDAENLTPYKDLIVQMVDIPVTALDEEDVYLNARIYYALCDQEGNTLFDVAMWAWGTEEDGIFVNGTPCEEESVFYETAQAFLPPDAAAALKSAVDQ